MTMALATRGTNFCREEIVRQEWELAKELDLNITVHVAMYRFGYTKMQLSKLKEMELLYPNTTYIHSSHLTEEEWGMVRDSGSNVSYAPQIELQMGHGWAQAVKAIDYGVPIGLSSDVATTAPRTSSPRCTRSSPRSAAGSRWRGTRTSSGTRPEETHLRPPGPRPWRRSAVRRSPASRIGPDRDAGQAGRRGDHRRSAVNVAPIMDPVGAVVCAADVSNVKTVLVAGVTLKDDFRLKASLEAPRKAVEASRDYLVSKFGDPEPGWVVKATA